MKQTDKLNFKLDLQMFAEDDDESGKDKVDPNKDLLDIIENLKKNTVPKSEYDKVVADRKRLVDDFLNGGDPDDEEEDPKDKPDIKALRDDLFKGEHSNLDYCKKALALRKAIMDEGGVDPFVPIGEKIIPDASDFAAAERVATVMQECIDASEGDSGVFTNLLQLRTIDVMPNRGKKK